MKKKGETYERRPPPYDMVQMSEDYFECQTRVSRTECIQFAAAMAVKMKKMRPNVCVDVKGLLASECAKMFGGLQLGDPHVLYSS
jgi:hypothetical protein